MEELEKVAGVTAVFSSGDEMARPGTASLQVLRKMKMME